jgi:hypothetical protein
VRPYEIDDERAAPLIPSRGMRNRFDAICGDEPDRHDHRGDTRPPDARDISRQDRHDAVRDDTRQDEAEGDSGIDELDPIDQSDEYGRTRERDRGDGHDGNRHPSTPTDRTASDLGSTARLNITILSVGDVPGSPPDRR